MSATWPLLWLWCGGDAAVAQDRGPTLNTQDFEPSPLISGFVTTWTARQLARARFGADVYASYGSNVWIRTVPTTDGGEVDERATAHLSGGHVRALVAPVPWLQISLSAPVLQFVTTGPAHPALSATQENQIGWGDLGWEIGLRALPEERGAGLAFTVFGTAPTGQRELALSWGVPTVGVRAALSSTPRPVHLGTFVGYRLRPGAGVVDDRIALDDELSYGAGVGFLVYRDVLRLNVEAVGGTTVGPGLGRVPGEGRAGLHTSAELIGSLRVALPEGFVMLAGAGGGLTPAPGTPDARAFLGFGYAPDLDPDLDRDGIPNHLDECRKEPEDVDGWQDDDGCPDPDNDEDGRLDVDDACPDDPEDEDGFEDEDGCPDRDNDQDRVADIADACPNDPEDRDRFQDKDGCPDLDNDRDGIADQVDACPDVPEDFDGFTDTDGCPEQEYDRDADGVIDNFDPCPDDPEDVDGWQDDDGCPEPDNDNDTILDPVDLCPDEPEIFNGNADEDGCPDETKAVLKGDRIVILEKVHFYVNDAKIRPESYGVLDAVAATMTAHPEILLLRVEGHTDSDGSDAHNQDLSERRAASVRLYLIERGVAAERLIAEGFGETFPIASNRTPEGKELNRRVEFVVVPPPETPSP